LFLRFYEDTGLNLAEVLVEGPSAPEVDPYKKLVPGQSLYNPEKLGELGTQVYLLIFVGIRKHHYFRAKDIIYVEFSELHKLCHLDSLDKSLISCYCL
jgi:hypothetical protein